MTLERVYGQRNNPGAVDSLVEALERLNVPGTLYIGYPILPSADETITVDALLTSHRHGVVVFHFATVDEVSDLEALAVRQDDIYAAVFQKLLANRQLRSGRDLAFPILVVSLAPEGSEMPDLQDELPQLVSPERIGEVLVDTDPLPDGLLRSVDAAVQQVAQIKPLNRRSEVRRHDSKGAIIREIEHEIANLDRWQKKAALETPEGPQRIRGLAGSGKTIVLALKAAYLHATNPDWTIAITFHTRSLYQQFRELVRRFYFEYEREEPDWDRLRVMHSWGGAAQAGVYSVAAGHVGLEPRTFSYARSKFGFARAFEGVCTELINSQESGAIEPIFDAVLIDEAQDLPQPFFELAYLLTRSPHRVVYAYDELQNLSDYTMAAPAQLFGSSPSGRARVPHLASDASPSQDIVLPVCYRNTRWALTVAHGLGFGTNREGGLVQFFDRPALIEEIGYHVLDGELTQGELVTIERDPAAHPDFFNRLLRAEDALRYKVFAGPDEQASWVADAIHDNLTTDELQRSDILVVLTDSREARTGAGRLMAALGKRGIPSHLVGVTTGPDEVFDKDSVAMAGVFRAKGNEAAAVYVLDSQHGFDGIELTKRRNALFTAITRSRAWVTICGHGEGMDGLFQEVQSIVDAQFQLSFRVPTTEQLHELRRVHRERSSDERRALLRDLEGLQNVLQRIERGELLPDSLPTALRRALAQIGGSVEVDNGDGS